MIYGQVHQGIFRVSTRPRCMVESEYAVFASLATVDGRGWLKPYKQ